MASQDFSPEDVFMLWEGLMASKYISSEEMRELVKKLSKYTAASCASALLTTAASSTATLIPKRWFTGI